MTVVTSTGIEDDDWVSSMSRTGQTIMGVASVPSPRQKASTSSSSFFTGSPKISRASCKISSERTSRSKTSLRSPRFNEAPWHDRHQVTFSKDNKRLPRQRRDYFDCLPSLRVSSGEYHEVPKHFAVSLDTFKGTSWSDQKKQLEARFALYPHTMELMNSGSGESSGPTSAESPKEMRDQQPEAAEANGSGIHVRTKVPMNVLLAALPDGGAGRAGASSPRLYSPGAKAFASSPRIKRNHKEGPSFNEQLMAASASASDAETFQSFMVWCKKNFGYVSACWRAFDESGNMSISKSEFFKKMSNELRYPGDVRKLWEMLDRDHSGIISFLHFDPESAMMLAKLKRWATEMYGSVEELCEQVDHNRTGKVSLKAFLHYCKTHGLEEEGPVWTLFKMCGDRGLTVRQPNLSRSGQDQTIVLSSLSFLDRWECPEYLWISADNDGLSHWRGKLMAKYKGNGIIAWRRELDKDESMRVNWLEFKTACKNSKDDVNVPGVWRALDNNLSGWLSLREFDPAGAELLRKFKMYAQTKFGSCQRFIESMDSKGSSEISRNAFRAALKKAGIFNFKVEEAALAAQDEKSEGGGKNVSQVKARYSMKKEHRRLSALEVEDEDIDALFSGLDVDGSGLIRAHEVRFLDRWDVARELAEEAVWEKLMKAMIRSQPVAHNDDGDSGVALPPVAEKVS
eukprot:gnl/MRDRNA2_/MRDRNA2_34456_c0_seq1.p1 gnl/MRDRNA2_/MRDRNA2_34456_c0~~gnl/MRDRNA2_/MRDRNA2_34456_c0_seq1.p1  ORF type:complete len:683 (+),score=136.82 gnl/MRDRNA2_/MRDRNA2_34456_c0_seq1:116-2164(+)